MQLPVDPPILPMLAKRVPDLPSGDTWIFEPKWDGFRALVFRDGNEILIQSRDAKSLNRYFPELLEVLRRNCLLVVCSMVKSWSPGMARWISKRSNSAFIRPNQG